MRPPNETEISRAVQQVLALMPDVIAWRNNTGKLQDRNGRWITYGLGVGGADLVGLCGGRFFALEVKVADKKPTAEQLAWHNVVRRFGGFVAVVTSAEGAIAAVHRCRSGESQ